MQTFLPHSSYAECARILDNKRLNEQKVECKQIFLALTEENYGWKNHPAVLMWKGYRFSLLDYALYITYECIFRGMKDTLRPFFVEMLGLMKYKEMERPPWLTDNRLISSHRANLLRKDPIYYGKFGWTEQPANHYFWPTHHQEYRKFINLKLSEEDMNQSTNAHDYGVIFGSSIYVTSTPYVTDQLDSLLDLTEPREV